MHEIGGLQNNIPKDSPETLQSAEPTANLAPHIGIAKKKKRKPKAILQ